MPPPAVWSRGLWALLLGSSLLLGVLRGSSAAQITLDGSLGPPGPLTGPDYRIGAELGQLRGSNLFHSFGAFNVPTGGSASFAGPNTITNILGRVTGGQPSSIDGVLRSEIAGANLYLLNPSGVLFGPNAALEVSGSFHVSTADVLRFADGAKFSANLGQESVLTVAPPAAFGFLGNNPAAIAIRGSTLQVPDRKALSVVGGDVQMMGGVLRARSGRIQLASVASPGDVRFSPLELAPDLQLDGFARLGQLALSQEALVTVSNRLEGSDAGAGTVLLRGGHLLVDNASIQANTATGESARRGIDLRVAEDVVLTHGTLLQTESTGAGRAGDIAVEVGRLTLAGGAGISSFTSGAGPGGAITLTATDAIAIVGSPSDPLQTSIWSITDGPGDAGRVLIRAPTLSLDGGDILTIASGAGRGATS
jgi:filamentous hemagglutinin family protein